MYTVRKTHEQNPRTLGCITISSNCSKCYLRKRGTQTTKPDSSVPMQLTLKSDEQERQKVHVQAQFAKKTNR